MTFAHTHILILYIYTIIISYIYIYLYIYIYMYGYNEGPHMVQWISMFMKRKRTGMNSEQNLDTLTNFHGDID